MKIAAIDRAAMLAAVGETITITDDAFSGTFTGLFRTPGSVVSTFDGEFVAADPTLIIDETEVDTYQLIAGEEGTEVKIGTVYYRMLSIVPDGGGFANITLEKV